MAWNIGEPNGFLFWITAVKTVDKWEQAWKRGEKMETVLFLDTATHTNSMNTKETLDKSTLNDWSKVNEHPT